MGAIRLRTISLLLAATILSTSVPGCRRGPTPKDEAREAHRQRLKSYVDPAVLPKVDPDFFTYKGFGDWYRVPLVYPYHIVACDSLDSGILDRTAIGRKVADPNGDETLLWGITHLAFDSKIAVMRVEGHRPGPTSAPAPCWVVFEFATGGQEQFDSERKALAAAKAKGFAGSAELETLEVHYDRF